MVRRWLPESTTVKVAGVVPTSPSATETSLMDSDGGGTPVTVAAVLFGRYGSGPRRETMARFVNDPTGDGVATMMTVAVAPPATLPRSHWAVPDTLTQLPWEEEKETRLAFAGRTFVRLTPVAEAGPELRTLTV